MRFLLLLVLTLYPWREHLPRAAAAAGRSAPGCILQPGGAAWTADGGGTEQDQTLACLRGDHATIHRNTTFLRRPLIFFFFLFKNSLDRRRRAPLQKLQRRPVEERYGREDVPIIQAIGNSSRQRK